MKNSKKLMAALLCFVIVISCLYVNVFAAYATVGAGKVSCNSGETVDVPVYISGNSGITNIEVKVSFDSTLLEAVSAKSETAVFTAQNPEVNGNYVSYLAYNTETVTNNGNLFVITFKAIADDTANAELKVDVTAANNVVDDVQSQISTSNGSVTIGTSSTTSTESTTKAVTTVTETVTESTTKNIVTVTEPSTESTTKSVVTVTEPSSETTSKTITTESTTESTTSNTIVTTKKQVEDEEDTETTTKSGKASGKATVTVEKTTADQQTEETTKTAVPAGSVSVVIGQNKITINGSQKSMDAAAYIQASSSSTMVPLRFVSEAVAGVKGYDAIIDWNGASKTAVIKYGDNTLSFTSGSNIMIINGKATAMENGVCAEIKNGRMYIPFRALGNALDVNVDWDAQTKTAVYSVK